MAIYDARASEVAIAGYLGQQGVGRCPGFDEDVKATFRFTVRYVFVRFAVQCFLRRRLC